MLEQSAQIRVVGHGDKSEAKLPDNVPDVFYLEGFYGRGPAEQVKERAVPTLGSRTVSPAECPWGAPVSRSR
jgi:hypothetical protein